MQRVALGIGDAEDSRTLKLLPGADRLLVGVLERFSFRFGGRVAAMMDVVAALGGGEARQTLTEERPERVDRAAAGFADDGFEFGEAQLDGVEVGAVGREEAQRRADGFNGVAHAVDFVSGEIVGNHDVAGLQRRHEDLFDVGEEADPVHRAIQDAWSGQPRHPQRGDEGAAFPPTLRRVIGDPLAARAAPIPPQEIGGDPAFIEKDEAGRVESRGGRCPLRAGGRDVWAIVFGRAYRFFYG